MLPRALVELLDTPEGAAALGSASRDQLLASYFSRNSRHQVERSACRRCFVTRLGVC